MIVYEVTYSVPDTDPRAHGGPGGDGIFTYRTRLRRDADMFASAHIAPYSQEVATVRESDVPLKLARRWGLA